MFVTSTILVVISLALTASISFGPSATAAGARHARRKTSRVLGPWDRCAYGITVLGFAVMAVTGLGGWLCYGHLYGWLLLIHVSASPIFIGGLIWMAIRLAERCCFTWSADRAGLERTGSSEHRPAGSSSVQKAAFWMVLLLGFVSMASMMVATLPFFGHTAQETLYSTHLYSGIGLLIVAVVHACLLITRTDRR